MCAVPAPPQPTPNERSDEREPGVEPFEFEDVQTIAARDERTGAPGQVAPAGDRSPGRFDEPLETAGPAVVVDVLEEAEFAPWPEDAFDLLEHRPRFVDRAQHHPEHDRVERPVGERERLTPVALDSHVQIEVGRPTPRPPPHVFVRIDAHDLDGVAERCESGKLAASSTAQVQHAPLQPRGEVPSMPPQPPLREPRRRIVRERERPIEYCHG